MPDLLRAWGDMFHREPDAGGWAVLITLAIFGALLGLVVLGALVQHLSRNLARRRHDRAPR